MFLTYAVIGLFGALVFTVSKGSGKALVVSISVKPYLRTIIFGILMDLIIGAGAGFVAGNVLSEMLISERYVEALTFVAGYAGDKFLNNSVDLLNDRVR